MLLQFSEKENIKSLFLCAQMYLDIQ